MAVIPAQAGTQPFASTEINKMFGKLMHFAMHDLPYTRYPVWIATIPAERLR
jgi:hypothetical protein